MPGMRCGVISKPQLRRDTLRFLSQQRVITSCQHNNSGNNDVCRRPGRGFCGGVGRHGQPGQPGGQLGSCPGCPEIAPPGQGRLQSGQRSTSVSDAQPSIGHSGDVRLGGGGRLLIGHWQRLCRGWPTGTAFPPCRSQSLANVLRGRGFHVEFALAFRVHMRSSRDSPHFAS